MAEKFYMTDGEITANFRQAKNKQEQIKVLAELNAVDKGTMLKKLEELGCISVGAHPAKRTKTDPLAYDPAEAERLYAEGKNDREIAQELGISYATVRKWRVRNGLPGHRGPKKKDAGQGITAAEEPLQEAPGLPEDMRSKDEPKRETMRVTELAEIFRRIREAFPEALIHWNGAEISFVRIHIQYDADLQVSALVELE